MDIILKKDIEMHLGKFLKKIDTDLPGQ